ncbi:MAG: glycosyltransferase family 4 protein [Thermotogae bacterium]|nr:glycosyltransferase family 4 protein [Thermotogota bacterium]
MKVAYVHDWLLTRAGAERVLEEMLREIPGERIYTLLYDESEFRNSPVAKVPVETSFLSKFPFVKRYYRKLLPLMPMAVESFNLRDYDLIISSSHAVAKGIIPHPGQVHISYVHTPMRYAWDLTYDYLADFNGVMRFLAGFMLSYVRVWDYASSGRVDVMVANSKTVAARIRKYYNREAKVIYPPVDVHRFRVSENVEDYFVVVSRLVPYKRIDLIVEAFSRLGLRLLVVGDGPDMGRLKRMAGRNVEFLGRLDDDGVAEILSKARAFVFAAYEDFGISPVEALASGVPVIAYGRGGVSESVEEGRSGVFFYEQTVDALVEAVRKFLQMEDGFNREDIRKSALRFSPERFRREFRELVRSALGGD